MFSLKIQLKKASEWFAGKMQSVSKLFFFFLRGFFHESDGSVGLAVAMLDPIGTGPLSFHCKEWEVVAALWNQPHALPSSLGTTEPRALAQVHWLISLLGMGGPEWKPHWIQPTGLGQSPITFMPPLGLQAHVTELDNQYLT